MTDHTQTNRRQLLVSGMGAALSLAGISAGEGSPAVTPEEGITAPEDLMREHGVLSRCLLIYEEGMRRIRQHQEVPADALHQTADTIRRFIQDYHERNEEKYVFPAFQRAGKLTDLVAVLLAQHKAGRAGTDQILRLSQTAAFRSAANRTRLASYAQGFIRMYRPHKAREDTVLFPAMRTVLTPTQMRSLADRMEEDEEKVLGHQGFERTVTAVAAIEKRLGIYDLKQFTPQV